MKPILIPVCLAPLLAACVENNDGTRPAFAEEQLAQPFEDGQVLRWFDEFEAREFRLRIKRAGGGYELWGDGHIGHMCEMAPLQGTSEEDYFVQCYLPSEDVGGYYYYALWRDGDLYRARPVRGYTRAVLMREYRDQIYPSVRASGSGLR